ncbi:MAG: hypothetical protein A2X36_14820 [Elusimicrobia bacterium GWA2_69_24]|nr:MAG: hypothetical protein A2X36_14820 [Elusimicrobia bacterium GWA2_69_24]HBL19170.1 hypothetical protein [Elusimicrobiota bacterium]
MTFAEELLIQVLALDRAFADQELFHAYLGPRDLKPAAARIPPLKALAALKRLEGELDARGPADDAPGFRRTYYRDFLACVIAQAELFAFRRRRPFVPAMTALMGAPPPPPFALDAELRRVRAHLRAGGYSSIARYNREKRRIRFAGRRELERFVRDILDRVRADLLTRCRGFFPFDLRGLLDRSRLSFIQPRAGEPPCFYRYEGNGAGTVGIALRREFSESYLRGFVLHELIPGHHLYYLLKQRQVERGGADLLLGADTFYSPENPVNEGLAVCADRVFGPVLEAPDFLAVQVEKFLHRAFYNAWHRVNVQRRPVGRAIGELLAREAGFTAATIRSKFSYHTRVARHYAPVYPIGIRLIEEATQALDRRALPLLYCQHSMRTLAKLTRAHAPS